MPCSFGPLRWSRSGAGGPTQTPSRSGRDYPLQTAGARCLGHAGGTAGEDEVSHKGAVNSAELDSRSGPASALSDLVDHKGESDANHPGVLGQGDALLGGTQGTLLSHAGCPQVQAEGAQGKGG
jgi:hypothetical protein